MLGLILRLINIHRRGSFRDWHSNLQTIAIYAIIDQTAQGAQLYLRGLVGALDGSQIIHSAIRGNLEQGQTLGETLAQNLLAQGANTILQQVYDTNN